MSPAPSVTEVSQGITVIVPTIGRDTLHKTIQSVAPQLRESDALVVVSEGENKNVRQIVKAFSDHYQGFDWGYAYEFGQNWGHGNRNYILDNHVHTSHVWTIDDDDVATPDAIEAMRAHMDDPWTVFKMRFEEGHFASGLTIWRAPRITPGDIGTPMIFAPLGDARFGLHYMGDLDYAYALQAERGEAVWAEEVVALIRPEPVPE